MLFASRCLLGGGLREFRIGGGGTCRLVQNLAHILDREEGRREGGWCCPRQRPAETPDTDIHECVDMWTQQSLDT